MNGWQQLVTYKDVAFQLFDLGLLEEDPSSNDRVELDQPELFLVLCHVPPRRVEEASPCCAEHLDGDGGPLASGHLADFGGVHPRLLFERSEAY